MRLGLGNGLHKLRNKSNGEDPDLARLIACGSLTDPTEIAAHAARITALKSGGFWTTMYGEYPISPESLTAALCETKGDFNASQTGSPTHSTLGVIGNGTTQFINSNFNAKANASLTDFGVTVYINNNVQSNAIFGASDGPLTETVEFKPRNSSNIESYRIGGATDTGASVDSSGVWSVIRDATTLYLYRDGVLYDSTAAAGGALPARTIYFLASNGLFGPSLFSTFRIAYAAFHTSAVRANIASFHAIIQTYEDNVIGGGR